MEVSGGDLTILAAVMAVRFLLPLLIPAFPLPAVIACAAMDALDQDIFATFTSFDLAGYQGYDKAFDIYYLSIAMLAVLRNWTSAPAVRIARVLFYLRLIGVAAFELSEWRPMLLLFPNVFEYFFVVYELVRSRWSPERVGATFWTAAAAVLWIFVKVPQEYFVHIAQLDFSDSLAAAGLAESRTATAAAAVIAAAAVAALLGIGLYVVRRVAGPPEHRFRFAADALPNTIDEAHEYDRRIAARWRLFDHRLLEKVVLVSLVTVIFAQILPDPRPGPLRVVTGSALIVTINTLLRIRSARARRSLASATLSFLLLAATNAVLAFLYTRLVRLAGGALNLRATLLFLLLLTLIVTLFDRYHPVFEERFADEDE